ncbi:MAG: hypothetical protein M3463_10510 [Verrucomicrobiota bacterium]|nr:hypothetical protein [Verrucomicrobiota bacterium]
MKTEPCHQLHLALDERNLAHFLAALALSGLAERIQPPKSAARMCWWEEDGAFSHFVIETEFDAEYLRKHLFAAAHQFVTSLKWVAGIGGVVQGLIAAGDEIGINPFGVKS